MYLLWNPVIGSDAMTKCHSVRYIISIIASGSVRLLRVMRPLIYIYGSFSFFCYSPVLNLDDTRVSELDDEEKERIYRKVLEKLPKTEAGKVLLKDDTITVFLAFSQVLGSVVFVLVPFFFVLDENSASVLLNALLILTLFTPHYLIFTSSGYFSARDRS